MKKIIFSVLAVLLSGGIAFSASIPQTADPVNGAEIWLQGVYASAALDVGDVVVYDVGSSTGDDKLWVATTTTAATFIVAGVVYPRAIAAGDRGTIAIKGPVQVDLKDNDETALGAGALVCSSGTAGDGSYCLGGPDYRAAAFGYLTTADDSGNSATVYVFGR